MKESNRMTTVKPPEPFKGCPALDGYHCQTNSLAKMFACSGHPISEDMLLGIGAGMGFIYWQMKMGEQDILFVGGRGNNKDFFYDIGTRTGTRIDVKSTSSMKKAEEALLRKLAIGKPAMVYGDMGFLPWFDLPEEYHFGGHTFVVCGYDGKDTVLASDMDPTSSGLKRGFYCPITLQQLGKARDSKYKPFPPGNAYLEFDFSMFHEPGMEDISSSIRQTAESLLNPPIKNVGVKGLRHTALELPKWRGMFCDVALRMNLFNLYIYIEIGGTGGGCFRKMYSRFLEEAAQITKNGELTVASRKFAESAKVFSEIGNLFINAETDEDINERIKTAACKFNIIADIEEEALSGLQHIQ
jgi:hypothetical protein